MGSGTDNRKQKDRLIIRRPAKITGDGFRPGDQGSVVADTCVPSFDQRVTQNHLVTVGVVVQLRKQGDVYAILFGETEIGKLSQVQSTMVTKCSALGVRYKGVIVGKKGRTSFYARFSRIPG